MPAGAKVEHVGETVMNRDCAVIFNQGSNKTDPFLAGLYHAVHVQ